MTQKICKPQAFKLKGRLYTFTVLQLSQPDCALIKQQLLEMMQQAPSLLEKAPIVLDCSKVRDDDFDLVAIANCLRDCNLLLIGIQSDNLLHIALAEKNGFIVFNSSTNRDRDLQKTTIKNNHVVKNGEERNHRAKIYFSLVRSGQQIVSKDHDLIIAAAVSSGAELLADGNIHVYGTLRGRALAGISGNKEARIFCQALEAELVAIAGLYCLNEKTLSHAGPCQIYLQDGRIQISSLGY